MKKLLLSFILGILMYPLMVDIIDILNYNINSKTIESIYYKIWMPSYGISDPFTKNCTKDISKNGHGWVFINRDYYTCNKFQIYISDIVFGEYTKPIDKELLKQLKTDARLK